MRFTRIADVTPEHRPHRGSALQTQIMQGRRGSPSDFGIWITTFDGSGDYHEQPRHTHNIDQIRFILKGQLVFGPHDEDVVPAGGVGFFGAGVYYGPLKVDQKTELLTVQVGAANGEGYTRLEDLIQATKDLSQEGTFVDAGYVRTDAEGRTRKTQGWRAVWERANGRPFAAPKPRIPHVMVMDPSAYRWVAVGDRVAEKRLGVFNERGTGARLLKIEPGGTYRRQGSKHEEVMFVLAGELSMVGEVFVKSDTLYFEPQDDIVLAASEETTILVHELPAF